MSSAAPAHAAFPGANGKIAYSHYDNGNYTIRVMNSDGSGQVDVAANGFGPKWSPDGTMLTFESAAYAGADGPIYVANADGSAKVQIASDGVNPTWAPDGSKITFASEDCTFVDPGFDCFAALYTVNPDGTGRARIGGPPDTQQFPWYAGWSPSGSSIAFTGAMSGDVFSGEMSPDIFVMKPDGSDQTELTATRYDHFIDWSPDAAKLLGATAPDEQSTSPNNRLYTINPDGTGQSFVGSLHDADAFSPDGKKILFHAPPGEIFAANTDGTAVTQLTHDTTGNTCCVSNLSANWQPIPQTYARPKGATPMKTYLVPAYKPCTAPNRTHGSPLAFPSCAPPQQASDFLTIGTADSNGQPTTSVDSVRYDVIAGNPATPADEADVAIQIAMRDIRNRSDLSDYTGEVQVTSNLRITDKDNTPNPGGPGPGTTEDTPLSATVQCAATADTTTGSLCNLTTSVDALYPGAVKEGRRSVWALGQVQVYDGGADGVASTTGDNTLFMDQGVFIP